MGKTSIATCEIAGQFTAHLWRDDENNELSVEIETDAQGSDEYDDIDDVNAVRWLGSWLVDIARQWETKDRPVKLPVRRGPRPKQPKDKK